MVSSDQNSGRTFYSKLEHENMRVLAAKAVLLL